MSRFRRKILSQQPFRRYLQSTGKQYINTGLTITNLTGTIEIKFSPTDITATSRSGSAYNGVVGQDSTPQIGWFTGGWTTGDLASNKPYIPEAGKIYTATWGYDTNAYLYIDGQNTGISRTGTLSVILFYVASKPDNAKVKVYYCKITDTSGKVTHYFVPCIQQGKAGLWDRVENKFYTNSGSDYFIIEKGISYKLNFYDYIESTGTQYIDTGLTVTKSTGTLEIKFSPTYINGTSPGGTDYSGVVGLNSTPQIGWYTEGWTVGNAGSSIPYIPEVGKIYTAAWGYDTDEHLYIDEQDTGLSRSGTMSVKICWIATGPANAKVRVYYSKITDVNGNIIHYFVPCTYNGITCMYDTIEKKLYENAGTGDFIMGNKIELT